MSPRLLRNVANAHVWILALALIACASANHATSPSSGPRPCPSGGLDAEHHVADTSLHLVAVFVPPMPIPPSVRGHKAVIRAVVDSGGRVLGDSTIVCGIDDRRYAVLVARMIAKSSFTPERLGAPPRPAASYLTIEFF